QLLADPSGSLTLSGQANLSNPGGQLTARGKFTVDKALFSLPEQRAPSLGDDVVIYRAGQKPKAMDTSRAEPQASPFLPVAEIDIDLGRRFRFQGAGAKLRLAGSIHVSSAPNQAPSANGTIRIADGEYEAFGALLEIERGIITFNGNFTNPMINILAMRRGQEVEAGVHVTGTARQPRVQLVSEPDVAEEEKLSWLVFGRAGSSEGGGAEAAARGAALGLLNSLGGDRIAKGLGLDEVSIGTSEFGQGTDQVINLGKSISDRLHVGYEQSLAGAGSVLKLTYDLGRAWSVVLRGGQVTGLDMFYNKRFD
ncbi:MAG: translocation/assembly module TamB domain-containing protein, partial [Noviherbaspirillum sp.]